LGQVLGQVLGQEVIICGPVAPLATRGPR
jgi:hypothetical protein